MVGTITSAVPTIAALGLALWLSLLPSLLQLIFYGAREASDFVTRDIQLTTVAGLTFLLAALPIFTGTPAVDRDVHGC
jgi:hypothetical protein